MVLRQQAQQLIIHCEGSLLQANNHAEKPNLWKTCTHFKWAGKYLKVMWQLLPQDENVPYSCWKLSHHWQMLPNQSLPSVRTATEDRTVLYWTEVESGSAKAVEGIDPSVDTLHYAQANHCWLLFLSVLSSLQGDCYLALALIFIWSDGIHARVANTEKTVKVITTHSVTAQSRINGKPIYWANYKIAAQVSHVNQTKKHILYKKCKT